jgi:ATP-binding cassette subfamily B protein
MFIVASPRYVMEAIGMVLIAALAYGLSKQSGGVAAAVPILGALALGAQRLLPTLQQAYAAWANLAARQDSLADAIDLLKQDLPPEAWAPMPPAMQFMESIRFRKVRFRYLDDGPWVIAGLDMTIPKRARVGFVGTTGSGKSTTIDLLMGLLTPTEGQIVVDGVPLTGERLLSWQRAIAHVPQSIFLIDASLVENIALGVPRTQIDMKRVKEAARQAQLANFVESLRDGYDTHVGERGVQLSGGQRQRVGIARALYKEASVLIFDEATSSLDNETEKAVMDAIESLNRDITILLIAHRLTTVKRCDLILELVHGKLAAQGSFEQLLEQSPSFRTMALAGA